MRNPKKFKSKGQFTTHEPEPVTHDASDSVITTITRIHNNSLKAAVDSKASKEDVTSLKERVQRDIESCEDSVLRLSDAHLEMSTKVDETCTANEVDSKISEAFEKTVQDVNSIGDKLRGEFTQLKKTNKDYVKTLIVEATREDTRISEHSTQLSGLKTCVAQKTSKSDVENLIAVQLPTAVPISDLKEDVRQLNDIVSFSNEGTNGRISAVETKVKTIINSKESTGNLIDEVKTDVEKKIKKIDNEFAILRGTIDCEIPKIHQAIDAQKKRSQSDIANVSLQNNGQLQKLESDLAVLEQTASEEMKAHVFKTCNAVNKSMERRLAHDFNMKIQAIVENYDSLREKQVTKFTAMQESIDRLQSSNAPDASKEMEAHVSEKINGMTATIEHQNNLIYDLNLKLRDSVEIPNAKHEESIANFAAVKETINSVQSTNMSDALETVKAHVSQTCNEITAVMEERLTYLLNLKLQDITKSNTGINSTNNFDARHKECTVKFTAMQKTIDDLQKTIHNLQEQVDFHSSRQDTLGTDIKNQRRHLEDLVSMDLPGLLPKINRCMTYVQGLKSREDTSTLNKNGIGFATILLVESSIQKAKETLRAEFKDVLQQWVLEVVEQRSNETQSEIQERLHEMFLQTQPNVRY
jgi:hypothetical protein